MAYEIERDKTGNGEPSLSEMTSKAINILKRNKDKGFFLLVEGMIIVKYCSMQASDSMLYNIAFSHNRPHNYILFSSFNERRIDRYSSP